MAFWERNDVSLLTVVVGIPYAEPPLGDLRLKPPVLKTTLDGDTFDAASFGPGCLQPVSSAVTGTESETDL